MEHSSTNCHSKIYYPSHSLHPSQFLRRRCPWRFWFLSKKKMGMPHLYTCEGAIGGPPSCEGPGSSNNFHRHFRSKAMSKSWRLMTHKPPNSLRLQSYFQFTKQKLFPSLWVPFHRNFLLRESISFHLSWKRGKDKKYVRMAEKATLIIVILPPRESNFSFQPANLFYILSMSGLHCSFLRFPIVSDNPK